MNRILVLCHGETKMTDGSVEAEIHAPLSDRGCDDVERIGRRITSEYDLDRMYAAMTKPARETASILRLTGVEPHPVFESAWGPPVPGLHGGIISDEGRSGYKTRVVGRWNRLVSNLDRNEDVLVVLHSHPVSVVLDEQAGSNVEQMVSDGPTSVIIRPETGGGAVTSGVEPNGRTDADAAVEGGDR
jgi:broad specificity phosphatase PhoE